MTAGSLAEHAEHFSDWNHAARVDADGRVVHNVALSGSVSKNGYRYSNRALEQAAPLYDQRPVFLDHAADPQRSRDRSTRDLVGSVLNPRFEQGRIRGDIRVLDTEAGRTFLSLAASASPGLGMSHVVLARRSQDGSIVEQIEDVISVDAVINPATTTTFHEQTLNAADEASLAELVAERQDLLRRLESLEVEVDRLRPLEAELQQHRSDQAIQQLLESAQLPSSAVTDEFRQLLKSAPDDEFRRRLIADRQRLCEQSRMQPTLSHGRASRRDASGDQAFVSAIRRH